MGKDIVTTLHARHGSFTRILVVHVHAEVAMSKAEAMAAVPTTALHIQVGVLVKVVLEAMAPLHATTWVGVKDVESAELTCSIVRD